MAKIDELRNKRKLIFKKLSLIDLQIKNHHISPLDRDILEAYVKETALWMTKLDVFDITYKLDEKSKDLWEHTIAHKNMPKFQDLTKFLEVHAAALESTEPRHNKDRKSSNYFTRSDGCKFGCKESHPAYRCPKLKASTVPKRREMVGNSNLCFNCLSSGHTAEECRSKYKCTHCSELHSSLLHQ